MKECLDYIKDMAADREKLYQEIIKQKDINIELEKKNKELEVQISQKDKELERVRALANNWWNEYKKLHGEYSMVDAQCSFMAEALAQISPQLTKEMNEDLEEGIFSEIVSKFSRRNWW